MTPTSTFLFATSNRNMLLRTFGALASLVTFASSAKTKPNIILVLVDDQDVHMESLKHMPLLKKQVADEGTLYTSHYWYARAKVL